MNIKLIHYESELGTLAQKMEEAQHRLKEEANKFTTSD
jgi:hypothetical protein